MRSNRIAHLTCKATIRLVCDYLDGRLSPGVEDEIRQHLDQCKNCSLILDAARKTLIAYFDMEPPPASAKKAQVA
jgi:anti-sigma factor RsiW